MDQIKSDDKQTGESSSDSQATVNNGSATTQVGEKSAAANNSGNDIPFHEHPRFKELIEEKNKQKMEAEMLRREVETLKHQSAGNNEASQRQSAFDQYVSDLVDQGMDRSAAARFAQQQVNLMQTVASQNVAPLLQNQQNLSLSMAMDSFKKDHGDYEKYRAPMADILSGLSQQDKDWVLSNVSKGIEYLYSKAKELDFKNIEKENVEKGRQEAYDKKREKGSVTQSRSSSPSVESLVDELRSVKNYDAKTKAEWDRKEAELFGRA